MPLIKISNFSFRYSGSNSWALKNVNLEVEKGDYVLVAGPSSSGKSTLAYSIVGVIPHLYTGECEGSVKVGGREVAESSISEIAGIAGFVMQDPDSQLIEFKVKYEVGLPLENAGLPREHIVERVEEVLELMGLSGLAEKSPLELSGGEKQKVVIAAALALKPEILVLDDPTSNLDPESSRMVYKILYELNREHEVTIVLIDHKLWEVWEHVNTVVLMDRGRVAYFGPPDHLEESPGIFEKLRIDPPWNSEAAPPRPRFRARRSAEKVVKFENVSYTYPDGTQALRNVNLEIRKGEFVSIMGPNGSGKTTLAKHMNGLLKPSSGVVKVFGVDTRKLKPSRLAWAVGYVFQFPNHQIFNDSVFDEIAYSLRAMGKSEREAEEKVMRYARMFKLADKLSNIPEELSMGELKRLMIVSVLATGCEVIILDEPLTGMTRVEASEVLDVLKSLTAEERTVVMITHDPYLAANYSDRILLMKEGSIVAEVDASKAEIGKILQRRLEYV